MIVEEQDRYSRTTVMEILIFLPMFVAGFGCGYYLRDRVLKKRYPASARAPETAEPQLLDFKKIRMNDVWNDLRDLLPPGEP
jgi:hypothetical protein